MNSLDLQRLYYEIEQIINKHKADDYLLYEEPIVVDSNFIIDDESQMFKRDQYLKKDSGYQYKAIEYHSNQRNETNKSKSSNHKKS